MTTPQRSWSNFFFSIEGRVTRREYWLYAVLALAVTAGVVAAVIDIALG